MNPQSVQDLINAGYYGYNGWGNAEALADFRATGGAGKGGPTNQTASNTSSSSSSTTSNTSNPNLNTAAGYLNTAINNTNSAYQNLLNSIKGRTETAVASEYGKRGIPTSSGVVSQAQGQQVTDNQAQVLAQQTGATNPLYQMLAGLYGNQSELDAKSADKRASLDDLFKNAGGGGLTQDTTGSGLPQQTQPGVQRLADGSPATLGLAQYPAGKIPVQPQPSYVNGVNANPSSSQLSNLRAQPTITQSGGANTLQSLLGILSKGANLGVQNSGLGNIFNYRPY